MEKANWRSKLILKTQRFFRSFRPYKTGLYSLMVAPEGIEPSSIPGLSANIFCCRLCALRTPNAAEPECANASMPGALISLHVLLLATATACLAMIILCAAGWLHKQNMVFQQNMLHQIFFQLF